MDTATETPIRELDHRQGDGITVRLLWDSQADRVLIDVRDERAGESFRFEVEPGQALEAFQHPYAYATSDTPEPVRG